MQRKTNREKAGITVPVAEQVPLETLKHVNVELIVGKFKN